MTPTQYINTGLGISNFRLTPAAPGFLHRYFERATRRIACVEELVSRAKARGYDFKDTFPLSMELHDLARKIAAYSTTYRSTWGLPKDLFVGYFTPVNRDGLCFEKLCRAEKFENGDGPLVSLGRDVVLARPWDRVRLADSFRGIGSGKVFGEWREQTDNHDIELWMPFRIGWVVSGNHSISVGIRLQTGTVHVRAVRHVDQALQHLKLYGTLVFSRETKKYVGHISSPVLAAVLHCC